MEYHILRWMASPLEDWASISNMSTQSLVDLLKYRLSQCHNIHLSTSILIIQTYNGQPSMPTPSPIERLSFWPSDTLWVMHDHLDLIADLDSHPCTWWLASVLTHFPLMARQCQVHGTSHTHRSSPLTAHTCSHILGWTPVPVVCPPSLHIWVTLCTSWNLCDMITWPYGPTCTTTQRSYCWVAQAEATAFLTQVCNTCQRGPHSTWSEDRSATALQPDSHCSPLDTLLLPMTSSIPLNLCKKAFTYCDLYGHNLIRIVLQHSPGSNEVVRVLVIPPSSCRIGLVWST